MSVEEAQIRQAMTHIQRGSSATPPEHLPPGDWTMTRLIALLDSYHLDHEQAPLARALGNDCRVLATCPLCGASDPAVYLWNGSKPMLQCGCKKTFEDLAWELAVKQSGGSPTKAGVEFATLEIAAQACKTLGVTVPVDDQLKGRLAIVKNDRGKLTIEVEKGKSDTRPPGWNGSDKKTRWTFVVADEPSEPEGSEADGKSLLIRFATDGELFHSSAGEAFATVQVKDHRETYRIKSAEFRRWLNYQYYQVTGSAPSSKTLAEAVNAIEAIANYDGAEREVFCRLAKVGDKLYLDLCNERWEVVEIDADGWRVIACPARVKFRRAKGQLPLQRPEPGNINELRPFVNVTDESWVLLVGSLVAALRYPGPYFITLILAGHGGAKTTVMKFVRSLVDPNDAPVRTPPRDEHSLFLAGMNGLYLCLDNVSVLQEWLLDALCRVSTGGGLGVREHYSQSDEHICTVMRPSMLSTIVELTSREDFLSRCIVIRCPMIPKGARKAESELLAEFEKVRPRVLGALLTAASTAIRNLPNVNPAELPRMADAFRWVVAAEPGLGWEPGTFARHYLQCEQELDLAIMEHPVAIALRRLLDKQKEFVGTSSELSDSLNKYADSQLLSDQQWPRTLKALGGVLQRLSETLAKHNISITHRNRTWRIKWTHT